MTALAATVSEPEIVPPFMVNVPITTLSPEMPVPLRVRFVIVPP